MGLTPTNDSIMGRFINKNGDDYLQIINSSGTVLGWIDSAGTLQGSLIPSGSGISGTIAANQIAFGTAANTIGGNANFTWTSGAFAASTSAGATISDSSANGISIGETSTGGFFLLNNPASGTPGIFKIQQGNTSGNGNILEIFSEGTGASIEIENTDSSGSSGGITISSASTTAGGINIEDAGANGVYLQGSGSGGIFLDASGGSGNIALRVSSTTGLTITPFGGSALTGLTHASSDFTAFTFTNGILTAATPSSDERVKTDIKPFTVGLDAILQIDPITYYWDKEKSGIESDHEWVGFSAQNVQKVIPVATPVDPHTGYLEFNDKGVIAALVNAVKELSSRVVELENRFYKGR